MATAGAVLLLCLLSQAIVPSSARGVLSIKLLSFENKNGRTHEGQCCDPSPLDSTVCRNQCDYVMRLIITGLGRPLKYDSNDLHFQEQSGGDLTLTILFDRWPAEGHVKMNAFFYDYDDYDHTTSLVDWFETELSGQTKTSGDHQHRAAVSGNRQTDKTRLVFQWSRRCDSATPKGEDCDSFVPSQQLWPLTDNEDGYSRTQSPVSNADRHSFTYKNDIRRRHRFKSPFKPFSTTRHDPHQDNVVTVYTPNPMDTVLAKVSKSDEAVRKRKIVALHSHNRKMNRRNHQSHLQTRLKEKFLKNDIGKRNQRQNGELAEERKKEFRHFVGGTDRKNVGSGQYTHSRYYNSSTNDVRSPFNVLSKKNSPVRNVMHSEVRKSVTSASSVNRSPFITLARKNYPVRKVLPSETRQLSTLASNMNRSPSYRLSKENGSVRKVKPSELRKLSSINRNPYRLSKENGSVLKVVPSESRKSNTSVTSVNRNPYYKLSKENGRGRRVMPSNAIKSNTSITSLNRSPLNRLSKKNGIVRKVVPAEARKSATSVMRSPFYRLPRKNGIVGNVPASDMTKSITAAASMEQYANHNREPRTKMRQTMVPTATTKTSQEKQKKELRGKQHDTPSANKQRHDKEQASRTATKTVPSTDKNASKGRQNRLIKEDQVKERRLSGPPTTEAYSRVKVRTTTRKRHHQQQQVMAVTVSPHYSVKNISVTRFTEEHDKNIKPMKIDKVLNKTETFGKAKSGDYEHQEKHTGKEVKDERAGSFTRSKQSKRKRPHIPTRASTDRVSKLISDRSVKESFTLNTSATEKTTIITPSTDAASKHTTNKAFHKETIPGPRKSNSSKGNSSRRAITTSMSVNTDLTSTQKNTVAESVKTSNTTSSTLSNTSGMTHRGWGPLEDNKFVTWIPVTPAAALSTGSKKQTGTDNRPEFAVSSARLQSPFASRRKTQRTVLAEKIPTIKQKTNSFAVKKSTPLHSFIKNSKTNKKFKQHKTNTHLPNFHQKSIHSKQILSKPNTLDKGLGFVHLDRGRQRTSTNQREGNANVLTAKSNKKTSPLEKKHIPKHAGANVRPVPFRNTRPGIRAVPTPTRRKLSKAIIPRPKPANPMITHGVQKLWVKKQNRKGLSAQLSNIPKHIKSSKATKIHLQHMNTKKLSLPVISRAIADIVTDGYSPESDKKSPAKAKSGLPRSIFQTHKKSFGKVKSGLPRSIFETPQIKTIPRASINDKAKIRKPIKTSPVVKIQTVISKTDKATKSAPKKVGANPSFPVKSLRRMRIQKMHKAGKSLLKSTENTGTYVKNKPNVSTGKNLSNNAKKSQQSRTRLQNSVKIVDSRKLSPFSPPNSLKHRPKPTQRSRSETTTRPHQVALSVSQVKNQEPGSVSNTFFKTKSVSRTPALTTDAHGVLHKTKPSYKTTGSKKTMVHNSHQAKKLPVQIILQRKTPPPKPAQEMSRDTISNRSFKNDNKELLKTGKSVNKVPKVHSNVRTKVKSHVSSTRRTTTTNTDQAGITTSSLLPKPKYNHRKNISGSRPSAFSNRKNRVSPELDQSPKEGSKQDEHKVTVLPFLPKLIKTSTLSKGSHFTKIVSQDKNVGMSKQLNKADIRKASSLKNDDNTAPIETTTSKTLVKEGGEKQVNPVKTKDTGRLKEGRRKRVRTKTIHKNTTVKGRNSITTSKTTLTTSKRNTKMQKAPNKVTNKGPLKSHLKQKNFNNNHKRTDTSSGPALRNEKGKMKLNRVQQLVKKKHNVGSFKNGLEVYSDTQNSDIKKQKNSSTKTPHALQTLPESTNKKSKAAQTISTLTSKKKPQEPTQTLKNPFSKSQSKPQHRKIGMKSKPWKTTLSPSQTHLEANGSATQIMKTHVVRTDITTISFSATPKILHRPTAATKTRFSSIHTTATKGKGGKNKGIETLQTLQNGFQKLPNHHIQSNRINSATIEKKGKSKGVNNSRKPQQEKSYSPASKKSATTQSYSLKTEETLVKSRNMGVNKSPKSLAKSSSIYNGKTYKKHAKDNVQLPPQSPFKPSGPSPVGKTNTYLKSNPFIETFDNKLRKKQILRSSSKSKNSFTKNSRKTGRDTPGTAVPMNKSLLSSLPSQSDLGHSTLSVEENIKILVTARPETAKGRVSSLYTSTKNGTRISPRLGKNQLELPTNTSNDSARLQPNTKLSQARYPNLINTQVTKGNKNNSENIQKSYTDDAVKPISKHNKPFPTPSSKHKTSNTTNVSSKAPTTSDSKKTTNIKPKMRQTAKLLNVLKSSTTPVFTTREPVSIRKATTRQSENYHSQTRKRSTDKISDSTTSITPRQDELSLTTILKRTKEELATNGNNRQFITSMRSPSLWKTADKEFRTFTVKSDGTNTLPTYSSHKIVPNSVKTSTRTTTVNPTTAVLNNTSAGKTDSTSTGTLPTYSPQIPSSVQYPVKMITINPTTKKLNNDNASLINNSTISTNSTTKSHASAETLGMTMESSTHRGGTSATSTVVMERRLNNSTSGTHPVTQSSTARAQNLHNFIELKKKPIMANSQAAGTRSTYTTQPTPLHKIGDVSTAITIQNIFDRTKMTGSSHSTDSAALHPLSSNNTVSIDLINSTRHVPGKAETTTTIPSPGPKRQSTEPSNGTTGRNNDLTYSKLLPKVTDKATTATTIEATKSTSLTPTETDEKPRLFLSKNNSNVIITSAGILQTNNNTSNASVDVTTIYNDTNSPVITTTSKTASTTIISNGHAHDSTGYFQTTVSVSSTDIPGQTGENFRNLTKTDTPKVVAYTTSQTERQNSGLLLISKNETSLSSFPTSQITAQTSLSSSDLTTTTTSTSATMQMETTVATSSSTVRPTTPKKLQLTLPSWLTFPNKFMDVLKNGTTTLTESTSTSTPTVVTITSSTSSTPTLQNTLATKAMTNIKGDQNSTKGKLDISPSKPTLTTRLPSPNADGTLSTRSLSATTIKVKPFLKRIELHNLLPKDILSKLNGQDTYLLKTGHADDDEMGEIVKVSNAGAAETNTKYDMSGDRKLFYPRFNLQNSSWPGPKVMVPKKGLFVPRSFDQREDILLLDTNSTRYGLGTSGSEARHVGLHYQPMSMETLFNRYWPAILGLTVGTVFLVVALLTSIACRQQRLFVQRRRGWQQDTPQHLTTPPDTSVYSSSTSSLSSDNTRFSSNYT